jgi:hypothetical protein
VKAIFRQRFPKEERLRFLFAQFSEEISEVLRLLGVLFFTADLRDSTD